MTGQETFEDISREEITVKKFLEILDFNPDDYYELNDGTAIVLLTDLEEEQKVMLSNIGLIDVGYNLFYSETSQVSVDEKFVYLEPNYTKQEESLWQEIIERIIVLEKKCLGEGKKCPIKSSIRQLQITVKWKGALVRNMSFNDFVNDLYCFFIDSLKDFIKSLKVDEIKCFGNISFVKTIRALRHEYAHDDGNWKTEDRSKLAKNEQEFYQDTIKKNAPKSKLDFVLCQLRLLGMCRDFLDLLPRVTQNESIR
jgi:hypothetical protein